MNSIITVNHNDCLSCRACELSCPKNAIDMVENEEGFLYPNINGNCIECGVCRKKCPIITHSPFRQDKTSYLVQNKDTKVLKKSTSGGFFRAIGDEIIDSNGVVFGAAYDEQLNVYQKKVVKKEDLKDLQGSKYVESDTKDSYKDVKKLLEDGVNVLYTGTACQIAGLNSFLGKEYENLITVDIICHGVPSRKLFHAYCDYRTRKFNDELKNVIFRDKESSGWTARNTKIIFIGKAKKKYVRGILDPYFAAFIRGETYRESCYKCLYQNSLFYRPADFSIGDFFEIDKVAPEKNNKLGLSLVIVNSNKGRRVFELIKDKVYFEKIKEEDYLYIKSNIIVPSSRPIGRNNIYENIDSLDYYNSYKESKWWYRIKWYSIESLKKMYSIIKFVIRKK
ncbi:Coenzyme F420 hydrogenase/dehydrogenase, beta subunit C-terminal domain [Pseudobutyrivibrio sp.]|uniref:Coenzyme F420 hydrogenase/dehydrogenase, beta subunit C-terminal domain n=1 Tax=Pseudobutyrivibrio sp. TaxID=2014367 RepID=UPI001B3E57FB|nr:Coenzyme F420 hydrogenase/dehydrogenase, beta subunit C-terminal domain [Pseudobutyrivibrio sp.]MBP3263082.1 Coenzyme F420 hydrogenase/dehydrogenase, beta subunit C-terminal domain [Pseudobutyrivibrio sp.]